MALLEFEQLRRVYRRGDSVVEALRSVSGFFEQGTLVGLSGPSGSGKSTLLNILGLTDVPSSGRVRIDGAEVPFGDANALLLLRRSVVGYVFQSFNLVSGLTAQENVMLPLLINGVPRSEARRRAEAALARVGLEQRGEHLPEQLSGGEMQRVAVCRATVHHPRIILADEPTGNLDSKSGAEVLRLLSEAASGGTLVIMATHSEEALRGCSRVQRMRDGAFA